MTALQGHLAVIGAAVLAAAVVLRFAAACLVRRVLWRRSGFVQLRPDDRPVAAGQGLAGDAFAGADRGPEGEPRGSPGVRRGVRGRGARGRGSGRVSAIVVDTRSSQGAGNRSGQRGGQPRVPADSVPIETRLFGDLALCASGRAVTAVFEEQRYRLAYRLPSMERILAVMAELRMKPADVSRVMDACLYQPYADGLERRVFVRLIPEAAGEAATWHHVAQSWIAFREPPPRRRFFERGRRTPAKVRMRRCLTLYFNGDKELVGWTVHRGTGAPNPKPPQ